MLRTIITLGLGLVIGVSSTMIYQHIHIEKTVAVTQAACPQTPENPAATQEMDTTYTPQGRVLPMPFSGKGQ